MVSLTKNNNHYCLKYDGKIIGNCCVCIDTDDVTGCTMEIIKLRIHSAYRGQGYGTKLLQAVMVDLYDRGYAFVSLSDESDRKEQENNIYYKNGFRPYKYYLRAELNSI